MVRRVIEELLGHQELSAKKDAEVKWERQGDLVLQDSQVKKVTKDLMASLALMVQKEMLVVQVQMVRKDLQESLAYQVHPAELGSQGRKAIVECLEYLVKKAKLAEQVHQVDKVTKEILELLEDLEPRGQSVFRA